MPGPYGTTRNWFQNPQAKDTVMRSLILIVSVFTLALGAVEETKLPSNIQAILEKAEKDATKNRSNYEDANKKAFDASEKSLKAELEKLTKAGKLEEALAVKKVMEGFRAEIVARVDAEAAKAGGGKSGNGTRTGSESELTKVLIGRTYLMNGDAKDQLTFLANGVIDLPVQWTNRTGATWSYTDKFTVTIKANADTYVIKFNDDYRTYVSMRNGVTTESGTLAAE